MTNPLLRAAEWYASHGWPVFPCVPGEKKPLTPNGFKDATTDLAKIRAWWEARPDSNIGLATGGAGLVVVDCDMKNGAHGLDSWRELRHELAIPDNTPTAETPSKGMHVYYNANGIHVRNSAGKLAPGVDIRADGGYVLAPPSKTPQGEYCWALGMRPTELTILPLPQALAERLHEPNPERRIAPPITDVIPHGTQHDTLVSLAGSMRRRGMNVDEIDAALQVVNETRCEVPGPPKNIRRIAEDVCRLYEPAPATAGYNRTDLGNAERLVARFRIDLRHCDPLGGWMVWDGTRWAADTSGQVARMAQVTARSIYADAARAETKEEAERLGAWAHASENASRQRAMLDLAWSQPGIAVAHTVWDTDPWLLNVANGTIDLRTGELLPHRREDMITKLAPVHYDPQADATVLQKYLKATTGGDDAFAGYLQRAAGYTLTGLSDEETVFLVLGPAGTGKSTLVEALLSMLGNYGVKTPFDTFLIQRNVGGARPDLVAMRSARMVAAVEPEKGRKLAANTIKEASGGDTITARDLYKSPFSYIPTFKIWLAANDAPDMDDDDSGLWRRLHRLPFERIVPPEDRDPEIKRYLKTTGSASVLAWAVEGCLLWQQERLRPPKVVREKTADLRREFDPLAEFIADRCMISQGAEIEARALRAAYEEWARTTGAEPIANKVWGKRLTALGCQRSRKRTMGPPAVWWSGIGLATGVNESQEYDDEPIPF